MADLSEAQMKEFFEKKGEVELPPEVVAEEEAAESARREAQGKEAKTEEKASEGKTDDKKQDEDSEKRGGGSLAAALHEERQERRALKERLERQEREHAEWRSQADRKLQTFLDQLAKGKEAPPPDETDPVAYFKHLNTQLEQRLNGLEEGTRRQTEASKASEQLHNFVNAVRNHEVAFKQDVPDYDDASGFLVSFWRTEAEFAGVPPADVEKQVFIRSSQFANSAMQRGENPAKSAYELAKKLGYKRAEAKGEDKKDETLDAMKRVEKGQEAAKSVGGGTKDDDLTISALSQKSDDEIADLVADPKFWKKLEKRFA